MPSVGPEVLRLEDVPELREPRDGEVLVRLHAAGVNPVETYLRAGQYAALPPLPYTPGSDGAGVVEAIGGGQAPGLSVGDRIYTSGVGDGHVRRARRSAPSLTSMPCPRRPRLPRAPRWACLTQAPPAPCSSGEKPAPASSCWCTARAAASVWPSCSSRWRPGSRCTARPARSRPPAGGRPGAVHVVDHRTPGHVDELRALSDGRGYDLIVEMAAHAGLGHDLGLLARDGRVVVVGSRGSVEIAPRDLMSREADVRGMLLPTRRRRRWPRSTRPCTRASRRAACAP